MSESKYLSRGIDYLGDIGAKLRDLQGYRTLAHELIQNADDALTATGICFDIRENALIVENDGVFSDCNQIDEPECPWKSDDARGYRCDFHRFRHIAAGDKRGEVGTTGAFGIGFIAVYQITDRPELISNGRHWIIREENSEDQRIEICSGCSSCRAAEVEGTRFIFPWARDPDSKLRQALRAEAVPTSGPQSMVTELEKCLRLSLLFLKRLGAIDVRVNGSLAHRFQRLVDGDSLILTDGDTTNDQVWHIFRGEFNETANQLRVRHAGRIERKRSANVVIAIPETGLEAGLLCAVLPTEQSEGLPFHINADFFPTNNRKSIILETDYQSDWNREALKAAARAFGAAAERLPKLFNAKHLWQLLADLKAIADRSKNDQSKGVLAEFWNQVRPRLRTSPVILDSSGSWVSATDVCLLSQKEEVEALDVLTKIGIQIVHEDLRPYHNLLRSSDVAIPVLSIERVARAALELGLTRRTEFSQLPTSLTSSQDRELLWTEIARLLNRPEHSARLRADDATRLRKIALAPGRDQAVWPFDELYSGEEDTVRLFGHLGLGIQFVADEPSFRPLVYICSPLNAAAAINVLECTTAEAIRILWELDSSIVQRILRWFENRRPEVLDKSELKSRLGNLPIFPSAGNLYALKDLSIPGNFSDPLGLADLVDIGALGGRQEFLLDIGMEVLDFSTYATSKLPNALRSNAVETTKRKEAVLLLANRIGELKDNTAAKVSLSDCELIECSDGNWRKAKDCYFNSESVSECLGDAVPLAYLPQEQQSSVRDLYEWLGVAPEPRLSDVVDRIRDIISNPPSPAIVPLVQRIVSHLGKRLEHGDESPELMPLRTLKWLPGRDMPGRWYAPNEVYAVYQDFLFESQAVFLDAPRNIQQFSVNFFNLIGLHVSPSTELVVKHLLSCAAQSRPVHKEVYRFLNNNMGDPALNSLRGKRCLLLDGSYFAPCDVFWSDHPFGRYKQRLGEELRPFASVLSQLGARDFPDWSDAIGVIHQISVEFSTTNRALDDEGYAVLTACWRLISQALDEKQVPEEQVAALRGIKCVPNASRLLSRPDWMYFEDRAGLAGRFGPYLKNNVIPRPIATATALLAAGVRPLRKAVLLDLLECTNPMQDHDMAERINERRNELGRVIENPGHGQNAASILAELDNIEFRTASTILIRYRMQGFDRELPSPAELVPALYIAAERVLLHTPRSSGVPWAAISRELAIALFPDEDPGRFAAGLKEALGGQTTEEAAATLDELGFARLDTTFTKQTAAGGPIGTLGTDEPVQDFPLTSKPQTDHDLNQSATQNQSDTATPSRVAIPTNAGDGEAEVRSAQPLNKSKKGDADILSESKRRPVLRTYIPAPASKEAVLLDGLDIETGVRSLVDKAGINHVLEFELKAGRVPKEMPHNNPGYDIESSDEIGRIARYIEVKSLSGAWRNNYAVLSRRQFEEACGRRDNFWLYVVEHADSSDFRIYRIHNPAVSANHFMFDDGWQMTAEPQLGAE